MKIWRVLLLILAVLVFCIPNARGLGKSRKMRGVVVACDPVYHGLKQPSFVKNLEVTVADVGTSDVHKHFVKVIFEGFGNEQVATDVLNGQMPFAVRAVRDTSCDEPKPRWLTEPNSFDGSGPFVLNDSHKTLSVDSISGLECYRVRVGK
jgi:hypothetical protein